MGEEFVRSSALDKKTTFFLLAIALSIRNIPEANKDFQKEFLRGIEDRLNNFAEENLEMTQLSSQELLDIQKMASVLRSLLNDPDWSHADR
ncbi:MAG: hypothetical protein OXI01_14500 [Albidovulum sp.]|nr:hypothetical protein [Albidovulum sp.]